MGGDLERLGKEHFLARIKRQVSWTLSAFSPHQASLFSLWIMEKGLFLTAERYCTLKCGHRNRTCIGGTSFIHGGN